MEDTIVMRYAWILVLFAGLGCSKSGNSPVAVAEESKTTPQPEAQVAIISFADAVTETSPEEQQPPPDRTLTGLATAKLRERVQANWGEAKFVAQSGKAVECSATIETDRGRIVIALRPDIAPNHVRNFVALARAGYYDGLRFEHSVEQKTDDGSKLELIEGGCPLGTGEPGIGHLGYWLKPEFSDKVKHEEGTLGACRSDPPDSAACRFYITLSPAPAMDGQFTIFGKVTQGLDVARTIGRMPRPEGSSSPNQPAVIRSVTIDFREPPQ